MRKILLFAGTTEGRRLAGSLAGADVRLTVCAATEHGGKMIPQSDNIRVLVGRMEEDAMEAKMRGGEYDLVLDATHPYATEASENIRRACLRAGCRLIRVLREQGEPAAVSFGPGDAEKIVFVPGTAQAAEFLKTVEGNILVTTGSKELAAFWEIPGWRERVYARVLPTREAVEACAGLGLPANHLIAMQGPFSRELNLALLRHTGASWLVTKESGRTGGFEEKIAAAREAGAGAVVIRRPVEESGLPLDAVLRLLESEYGVMKKGEVSGHSRTVAAKRTLFLVGTGPGASGLLTCEAADILKSCDLIAGAPRVVRRAMDFLGKEKPAFCDYRPEAIAGYLEANPRHRRIAVVFSGDVGFYSGAKGVLAAFSGREDFETRTVCGISTAGCFFSKIGKSFEDVKFLSLHGRGDDLVSAVKNHGRVFAILGGGDAGREICRDLIGAGLSGTPIVFGENLSLPEERLVFGTPESLKDRAVAPLAVVYIENPGALSRVVTHGLSDGEFARGRTPMTKMEARCISVAKLRLTPEAVVYDIGAGTGSVAVECARMLRGGRVFAVERKPEALALIAKNRRRFALPNLEIVEGAAPEALEPLPAPTHVFIGGSGGRLEEILRAVLQKNPAARVVVNAAALETVAKLTDLIGALPIVGAEIVQITAARDHAAGPYHLMSGQNPVFVFSFCFAGSGENGGPEKNEECCRELPG